MPERYSYANGSIFADQHMNSVTHLFTSADGLCILDVTIFADDIDCNFFQHEQLPKESMNQYIAGYPVAFYHNTDNATLMATWIDENAYYSVSGPLTVEEITYILESMMNEGVYQ